MKKIAEFFGRVDREQIRAFVTRSIPEQVHLVAISESGDVQGRDFGRNYEAAVAWAAAQNDKRANVYFSPHVVLTGRHTKPSKAEVAHARLIGVDIDPPKDGSTFDKEAALERLVGHSIPPSFVLNSGNGLQAFYRVADGSLEQCEAVACGLIQQFTGDKGTHNFDRIMRLPGTVNWPNEQKKRRGRVPRLATIACPDLGVSYRMSDLLSAFGSGVQPKASPAGDITLGEIELINANDLQLGPDEYLRRLIEDPKNPDRSSNVFAFVCEALKARLTHGQIAGVLLNPENAVSAHCLDQPDQERTVIRAIRNATREPDIRILYENLGARKGRANRESEAQIVELLTLDQMRERFIFIKDGSQVADLRRPHSIMSLSDFRNATAASITRVPKNLEGDFKTLPCCEAWLRDKLRQECDAVTYRAGHGEFTYDPLGCRAFNTWRPFERVEPPTDWQSMAEPFLAHVGWLFGEEAKPFLDWLAHIEQAPGVLPHFGWLHIAKAHGMGRNWLSSVFERIWPGRVATAFDLSGTLNTSYNGRLAGRNLAIVDEIDEGNSGKAYQHAQKLKQLVTESTRHINPKYGRQHEEFNSCRWLVFSNSQAALPLEDKDRRFWVVSTGDGPKAEGYYRTLYALLDDELFIASVAHMLGRRNIADFNPGQRPPLSEAKLELLRRTRSETENLLLLIVDRWPVDLITKEDLLKALDGDCPSGAALRHAFDRAGIVKVKDLMETSEFGTRAKSSVFALRNHDDWKSAAAPKIRTELKRCDLDTKLSALFGSDDPEQDWMAEYMNQPKECGG